MLSAPNKFFTCRISRRVFPSQELARLKVGSLTSYIERQCSAAVCLLNPRARDVSINDGCSVVFKCRFLAYRTLPKRVKLLKLQLVPRCIAESDIFSTGAHQNTSRGSKFRMFRVRIHCDTGSGWLRHQSRVCRVRWVRGTRSPVAGPATSKGYVPESRRQAVVRPHPSV